MLENIKCQVCIREKIMERLNNILEEQLTESLDQIIISNPRRAALAQKIKIRPVLLKEQLNFQVTEYKGKQVFHENLEKGALIAYILDQMNSFFGQMELNSASKTVHVLVSKKGTVTIKQKVQKNEVKPKELSHNRKKRYILEEGTAIPFLVDLGVQTKEGKIVNSRYDKFRQINRFLEFIQDIVEALPKGRELTIVDFGCGKSYLIFTIFKNYLLEQGVDENHIISIELDQRKDKKYRNPDTILDFIESSIVDEEQYYVLLDEVQLLEEFEEVLNSLLHIKNVDVYVTGSNSKFLSKDVITEFRGRGDEIHIYPLTFKEFMQVYEGDIYHGWAEYVIYGGLPLTVTMKTEEQKVNYLTKLFDETYLIDIIERHHIEKSQELEDLVNILASVIGSLTNVPKIEATFKSVVQSNISGNTIRQYIEYLEDAFVINKANRYNVKGRKYIGTPLKYYFEDVGLRNARLGFRQIEETHIMENIVYNELRSRGYSVDVGVVEKRGVNQEGKMERIYLEIDFIANLGSKRYYIQSAFSLPTEEKRLQEKASLINVNDSFKKIILVKDVMNVTRDEDGITTMSIYDFLLKENSLEL